MIRPTVTIAGLDAVLQALLDLPETLLGPALRARYAAMRATIPPIPTRILNGRRTIAPAALWDRIQNVEIPQLYPVFPYGQYGIGRPDLQRAHGDHRATGRLDEDGHEAGAQAAVVAHAQPSEQRVHGLGVERRERVPGIGVEAEALAALACPRRAR